MQTNDASVNDTKQLPDNSDFGLGGSVQLQQFPTAPFYSGQPHEEPELAKLSKSMKPRKEAPVCRICLTEEEDAESDPLLSPCKCAGSMGFIHHQCLKAWFQQRRVCKK